MKVVEIRRRRAEDGEVERLARVFVREPGAPAQVEVLVPEYQQGLDLILADGAVGADRRLVHLADGESFLDALPIHFHSSRFWAQEIDAADAAG